MSDVAAITKTLEDIYIFEILTWKPKPSNLFLGQKDEDTVYAVFSINNNGRKADSSSVHFWQKGRNADCDKKRISIEDLLSIQLTIPFLYITLSKEQNWEVLMRAFIKSCFIWNGFTKNTTVEIKRPFLNNLKRAAKVIRSAEAVRDVAIMQEEGLLGDDEPEEAETEPLGLEKGQSAVPMDENESKENTPVAIEEIEEDSMERNEQWANKSKDGREGLVKVENHDQTCFSEKVAETKRAKKTGKDSRDGRVHSSYDNSIELHNHDDGCDGNSDSEFEITGMKLFNHPGTGPDLVFTPPVKMRDALKGHVTRSRRDGHRAPPLKNLMKSTFNLPWRRRRGTHDTVSSKLEASLDSDELEALSVSQDSILSQRVCTEKANSYNDFHGAIDLRHLYRNSSPRHSEGAFSVCKLSGALYTSHDIRERLNDIACPSNHIQNSALSTETTVHSLSGKWNVLPSGQNSLVNEPRDNKNEGRYRDSGEHGTRTENATKWLRRQPPNVPSASMHQHKPQSATSTLPVAINTSMQPVQPEVYAAFPSQVWLTVHPNHSSKDSSTALHNHHHHHPNHSSNDSSIKFHNHNHPEGQHFVDNAQNKMGTENSVMTDINGAMTDNVGVEINRIESAIIESVNTEPTNRLFFDPVRSITKPQPPPTVREYVDSTASTSQKETATFPKASPIVPEDEDCRAPPAGPSSLTIHPNHSSNDSSIEIHSNDGLNCPTQRPSMPQPRFGVQKNHKTLMIVPDSHHTRAVPQNSLHAMYTNRPPVTQLYQPNRPYDHQPTHLQPTYPHPQQLIRSSYPVYLPTIQHIPMKPQPINYREAHYQTRKGRNKCLRQLKDLRRIEQSSSDADNELQLVEVEVRKDLEGKKTLLRQLKQRRKDLGRKHALMRQL